MVVSQKEIGRVGQIKKVFCVWLAASIKQLATEFCLESSYGLDEIKKVSKIVTSASTMTSQILLSCRQIV